MEEREVRILEIKIIDFSGNLETTNFHPAIHNRGERERQRDDDDCFYYYNSGLVLLIEGICAQILYLRFAIISGLRSHLLLFFFGRKSMLQEKAVSPRSHPTS